MSSLKRIWSKIFRIIGRRFRNRGRLFISWKRREIVILMRLAILRKGYVVLYLVIKKNYLKFMFFK